MNLTFYWPGKAGLAQRLFIIRLVKRKILIIFRAWCFLPIHGYNRVYKLDMQLVPPEYCDSYVSIHHVQISGSSLE